MSLILICNSSYRGIVELIRDMFSVSVSVGTLQLSGCKKGLISATLAIRTWVVSVACRRAMMWITVLTRWGEILRTKGDWVAATEKYQLAATHSERPDRKNPPASWVTLLGSWSHLLSDWGQTLQQSTDPLIELLESSRAEGKAHPRESMSRSKGSEQYKTFHANFNAFEKNYKSYTAHWLNSFRGQEPDGKSPVEISIWHQLNPESGDPTLGQMHAKLVANYKTLVDGFQPKTPEIPATPSVWPRQSASL